MNVFEDLITELKAEKLLENTVMDRSGHAFEPTDSEPVTAHRAEKATLSERQESEATRVRNGSQPLSENEIHFYHKRAVSEMAHLQMVEHVLTGVEREYMKIVPNSFDDFEAKKALHAFLKVTSGENSEARARAEFRLMQEMEAWCSALAARDRAVPVASLRQYCDISRPPLSGQALIALARFYRNLPYSEPVRAKFDFVITRVFAKRTDGDRRSTLSTWDEIIAQLDAMYKEWSSVALYSADEDDSSILLTALSFEDLATEAENAARFDELIASDYFGRLRMFKESTGERFYAPIITASAVDANVRVGNAYVDLIAREREMMDAEAIRSKYGESYDDSIANATADTLALAAILQHQQEPKISPPTDDEPLPVASPSSELSELTSLEVQPRPLEEAVPTEAVRSSFIANPPQSPKSVNKTFLAICIFLILASLGVYVYSTFSW
ncbi:MAG: hypothetical protein ABR530_05710 [Pyrinomonadaceae bacterium]